MDVADRGSKHVCTDCGIKYYDLKKAVVACPRCGAKPDPNKVLKSSGSPVSKTRRGIFGRYP